MQLFQRVKLVAKELAGSETKLAAAIGLPQRTLNGYLNDKSQRNLWDYLPAILQLFPALRRDWLYFGEGEMLEETGSRAAVSPVAPVSPFQTAGVPPLTTAVSPMRAATSGGGEAVSGDIAAELAALQKKLEAAQEAIARLIDTNSRLTVEMSRLNEERRQLSERLEWENSLGKDVHLPPVARGGSSEQDRE